MTKKLRIAVIREKISKVTRILSGRGIRVTQSGMNAFVQYDEKTLEPTRVNIPYLPDDASETLVSAIEGFVDHEVAHLLYSDSKAIVEAQKNKVQSLHNIIEDVYIERRMCKEFSGTAYNLNKMYIIFTEKFIEPKYKKMIAEGKASELDWWHLFCACACRAIGNQEHFKLYMSDKWHLIPNVKDALTPFEKRINTTTDSWENLTLSIEIRDAIYGKKEKIEEKAKEHEEPEFDDEDPDENEDEEIEDSSLDDESMSEPKAESEKEEAGSDDDIKDEEPETTEEDERFEDDEPSLEESPEFSEKEPETIDKSGDEGGVGGGESEVGEDDEEGDRVTPFESEDAEESMSHYDEFDDGMSDLISEMAGECAHASVYMPFTKDWDLIEKMPIPARFNQRWVTSIENKVSGMTGTLQKGLERAFRAANKSRWESGKKRGRVNASSLSRLLNNDPRVFRTREEIKTKEVAVSLLIDCSGSMSGSRINMATDTAWALSEVLSKLGINFEVLGFTTADERWHTDDFKPMSDEMERASIGYSRIEPVYIPIFKSFEERWGVEQKKRTACIPYTLRLANNVDGESVEYAAQRLLRQKEPGKTLIVLSDGAPCAAGSSHGFVSHLKEVVKDIEKKQVNVVGIGIQTNAVRDYYRKNVVIHKLEDLPTTVMAKLRDAIMQK